MKRLAHRLHTLREADRAGLAAYFTAGDPGYEDSLRLLRGLPQAGADVIELGMPFSDPIADGPVLQLANERARRAGQTLARTLELVADFRQQDNATPVVLMGYLNPLLRYGVPRYLADAARAGVDGFILVDLAPEHASEIGQQAQQFGLDLIRMTASTTPAARLDLILAQASGFIYHVMLAGTTGAALPENTDIAAALQTIRNHSPLPIAAGFGVRTPEQAAQVGRHADLVAVGTRLVEVLQAEGVAGALAETARLAAALRAGRD